MSTEPTCTVLLAFGPLPSGQEDDYQEEVPTSCSGQVNFTEAEEILQNEPMMAGMFTIDSHPAYVLFDSGGSHSFMSIGFAQRHNISLMAIPIAYRISTLGA